MAPDTGSLMGHCSKWAVGTEGKSLPRKPSPQGHPPLAFICSFIQHSTLTMSLLYLRDYAVCLVGDRVRENSELNRKWLLFHWSSLSSEKGGHIE